MSCRLPVVATRHSGIAEIVRDGITGILVRERDAVKLEDAIRRLAEDPEMRTCLGRAARTLVEETRDIQTINRIVEQIYEGLLRQAKPNATRRGEVSTCVATMGLSR